MLIADTVNPRRAELGIVEPIVCWLVALSWWRKGVDAKLSARVDVRAGGERAAVESTRGTRIGEAVVFVCVGIVCVEVLAWRGARVSDGLEASIEGLLKQIRSCNLGAGEGKLTSMILTSVIGVLRRQRQRSAIGTISV